MTWRVIVRISFTRDKGSRLRYRVEAFEGMWHQAKRYDGTWEGRAVSATDASKQFERVFSLLSDPSKNIGGIGKARLVSCL